MHDIIEYVIDEKFRTITIPSNGLILGVVGDKEINQIRFTIPKYCSGFDLSDFTARVNYVNPNGDGNYWETAVQEYDDDHLSFVWLLEQIVTRYVGDVKISVKLFKRENGQILKQFNTRSATGKVYDGFDVSSTLTPEEQESLLDKVSNDIDLFKNEVEQDLEEMRTQLSNHIDTENTAIDQLKSDLNEYKDGYEKGNLFSEAELYAENAYTNLSDGHIISSPSSAFNNYIIKVDTDSKYTFNNDVRFALPLGDDKYTATSSSLIENVKQIDISQYPNTMYLSFSFNKITYPVDSFIVSKGTIAKEDTYPEWIIGALKTEKDIVSKGIVSKTGLFSASGDNILLSSARSNLRKGIRLVFEATVTSGTDFEIGFSISESSANTYPHNIISITSENISYNNVNYPHGLSITGRLQMLFEYLSDGTVDVTLLSNGDSFKQNAAFTMSTVAVPYVKSNGLIATDCKFTFICTDIRKKIWCFGDSYFSYSTERWTYYLKEYGYDTNVLLDGFPGMSSVNAIASFAKLLQLGTPKIAIWFMGMNDGTDTDDTTPNADWVTERDKFITLCETNGIEPIFATIPNVPSINHKGKNKWIRESGYRYVDMCHAVGADVDVNWYGDMLSPDKIHPSESGAKALFAQVLLDSPEVMLNNL